jgi:hypothetical protein
MVPESLCFFEINPDVTGVNRRGFDITELFESSMSSQLNLTEQLTTL